MLGRLEQYLLLNYTPLFSSKAETKRTMFSRLRLPRSSLSSWNASSTSRSVLLSNTSIPAAENNYINTSPTGGYMQQRKIHHRSPRKLYNPQNPPTIQNQLSSSKLCQGAKEWKTENFYFASVLVVLLTVVGATIWISENGDGNGGQGLHGPRTAHKRLLSIGGIEL